MKDEEKTIKPKEEEIVVNKKGEERILEQTSFEELESMRKHNDKQAKDFLNNINNKLVESIKEINRQQFAELQMLCSMVEDTQNQIFEKCYKFITEGIILDNISLSEGNKDTKKKEIEIVINNFEMKDYQERMIAELNNKFIGEKFLALIPYYFTGIREDKVKVLEDLISEIDFINSENKNIIKRINDLEENIEDNNREIRSMSDNLFENISQAQTETEEGKIEDVKFLDFTNKDTLEKILDRTSFINSALIDELKLFEQMQKIDSGLLIQFNYDKEKKTLAINIKRGAINTTNKYIDIAQSTIKKLEKQIEEKDKKIEELQETQQEEVVEKLEDFKPIPIDKAIAFNDKLSNNLHKLENNTTTELVNTGGKKAQNSIMKVIIRNGKMTTSNVLEPFDKVVLQGIYSLLQKNQFFDIQMLKEEMTGNKNRHKGNIDKEIENSLTKLRTTLIKIELDEELQKTMKTKFERVGIEDSILPLRKFFVIKGGHEKSVFGLTTNSIYFDYAESKGQLISKDNKLLQGGLGNSTKESIIVTDYISTRIEDMKHQKEKNKSSEYIEEIKFDTIFSLILTEKDLKMKPDSLQKKKKRYIEQIKTILDNYKNIKYIKNYEEYSEGIRIKI